MDVVTGERRLLKIRHPVPGGKEILLPEDILSCLGGQMDAMMQLGNRGGKINKASKEKPAWFNYLSCKREVAN